MLNRFRDPVVNAMKRACDDMLRFTGEPARQLNAEYLFTVAVARQIDSLNGYYGEPCRIYLEKKTREFARDCLHPIKFGTPLQRGSARIRRGAPALSRNGRIDIAVYEDIPNNGYLGDQPICAIELKGFNPTRKLVLKDLKRNLEFFYLSGRTGGSVIESALFGALHAWSTVGSKAEEERKALDIKSKYENWLSELPDSPSVEKRVSTHQIRQDLEGEVTEQGEYSELNSDTIHNFVGVIVEFRPIENE